MANTAPIFSSAPDVQWTVIPSGQAANTGADGTGTVFTVWTADAANGGFLQRLRIKAPAVSTSTVMRVYINNGGATSNAANNSLFEEVGLSVVALNNTVSSVPVEIPMGLALPAGYRITVHLATQVTGAIAVTGVGGKF